MQEQSTKEDVLKTHYATKEDIARIEEKLDRMVSAVEGAISGLGNSPMFKALGKMMNRKPSGE